MVHLCTTLRSFLIILNTLEHNHYFPYGVLIMAYGAITSQKRNQREIKDILSYFSHLISY